MAFQIVDDLLDYTETEAVTGKPSGHDLREHKVTLPLIAALEAMDAVARRTVEEFFADPEPTDEGIAEVVELVRDHGGLEYARNRAEAYGERRRRPRVAPGLARRAMRSTMRSPTSSTGGSRRMEPRMRATVR